MTTNDPFISSAFEGDMANDLIIRVFENLATCPIRSPEAFRNVLIGGSGMAAINPLLKHIHERDASRLSEELRKTVAEGRMIHFGHVPNEVIRDTSERMRVPFEAGELTHPYESWVATSSWEGGFNGYYISQNPMYLDEILVVEMYGVSLPGMPDIVLVYDIVSLKPNVSHTMISPARMVYSNGHIETERETKDRGSNSLDPMVTFLTLLADASIPVEHVPAPVALNRARAKKGKAEIPPHTVVRTADYVASYQTWAAARGASKGGHHASPIPHWRRAHKRTLASGRVVPVRNSKVNWRDTEELHRLFYRVHTEGASR